MKLDFQTETTPMNAPLRRYETVASTNDIARDWARDGAPEGTVVVARNQTQGRGRRGRDWQSPPDCGLLFSMVVRPNPNATWSAGQLTIAVAVAMAQAIENVAKVRAMVKWPNDILLNGRKIGGVLCEGEWRSGALDFVIVGVGLNVLHTREQLPPRPIFPASSLLLETGRAITISEVEISCLQVLASTCSALQSGGWNAIRHDWESRCVGMNELVRVREENAQFYGVVRGLDDEGALVVATSDGKQRVVAGDVLWE